MSFYDFDTDIISEQLMPPVLRKPKHKAWLKVLLRPVQWLWELFRDWSTGSNYADWSPLTSYNKYDRVRWQDKGIYECIQNGASLLDSPTGSTTSAAFWIKVQDNFIGADQRVRFNSQIIVLEYALNTWFMIPSTDPQIYIGNNSNPPAFLLSDDSVYSSVMPLNSTFQISYLGNTFTFVTNDFTVWVPVGVWVTLGANNNDREKTVRKFVDKYRLAGIQYTVDTY